MVTADDTELVRRTLSGERRAFGILVDRYQSPVYGLALRMIGDRDEAEDVAQATFLKAFEKLGTYDTRYKFFSWLYRIAHNEAVNAALRRGRVERLGDEVASSDGPDDRIDIQDILEAALQELSMDHRSVLVLKHLEGMSYEEVAAVLGIPEKTVKSRLFSARMTLRDVLKKRGLTTHD